MAKQSWHEEIDSFITSQNDRCKINGPMYQSKHNHEIYQYGSLKNFVDKHSDQYLYNKKLNTAVAKTFKNGTCEIPNKRLDYPTKSNYPNVLDERICKSIPGAAWDKDSINRKNKFFKGVCWKNEDYMSCGDHVDNDFLMSKDAGIPESKISDAKKRSVSKCNSDKKCVWIKGSPRGYCLPSKRSGDFAFLFEDDGKKSQEKKAKSDKPRLPPKDFPKNITNPEEKIQSYLKKYYDSDESPRTGKLNIVKGDRCNPYTEVPDNDNNEKQNEDGGVKTDTGEDYDNYTIEDLKKMVHPLNADQRKIVRNILGPIKADMFFSILHRTHIDREHFTQNMREVLKSLGITDIKLQNAMFDRYSEMKMILTQDDIEDLKSIGVGTGENSYEVFRKIHALFKLKKFSEILNDNNDFSVLESEFKGKQPSLLKLFKKDIDKQEEEKLTLLDSCKELYPYRDDKIGLDKDEAEELEKRRKERREREKEEEAKRALELYPSLPQSVIYMTFKRISRSNTSETKGLLAWHSVGSGKTCTAAGIMEAMWNSGRQIIFMSSIDAIAANPPFKFHECVKNLFPMFKDKSLSQISKEFEARGISFLSFAKVANRLKKSQKVVQKLNLNPKNVTLSKEFVADPVQYISKVYGVKDTKRIKDELKQANIRNWEDFVDIDNCVFIIDEVHNLFRPLAHQKNDHNYVESHIIGNKHPNMKVVILTATPGDNVKDVLKLLNIVRNPNKEEIKAPDVNDPSSIEKFKTEIAGLVSYFDMSNDVSKFPRLTDNQPIKFPMSDKQFAKYIEAYKETQKNKKVTDYESLAKDNQLAKFWAPARKYSNMLYTFEKGMKLSELSSKLPALLEEVEKYPEDKQYIYSAFYEERGTSQGVHEIARQLVTKGYKKFTIEEATKMQKNIHQIPADKRFILITQKELGDGTKQGANLAKLLKVFNAPENKNGKIIQIMIASQGFNEGLDLKAVRHIHIFEPLVTMASDIQTIGRARRYCSHKDLEYDHWTVNVHRYMSDFPIDMEVNNTDMITSKMDDLQNNVVGLESELKDTTDKELKKELKEKISSMKKEITAIKKTIKQSNKINTADIENIDEFVFKESRAKMKQLFTIYHSMKESAIDCQVLHEFHGDDSIRCSEI
jgi:hypothetical protein